MTQATAVTADIPAPRAGGSMALALLVAGTFFMENLDSTVITPALPAMAVSFAAPPVALNIGVSAYMLTLGVFIPVSGWVAGRFGARGVFTAAIAVFTIASLLCGLAPNLPVFVFTRILQGIGGALMVPVGRLLVLRATPKDRLIGAIATLTWPALAALVLGPPLGGLIVDRANWRWIFYLNLPLGLIALALAWRIVPKSNPERAVPFDWPGFLLIGSGLFFLMAVAEILAEPGAVWLPAAAASTLAAGLLGLGVRRLRTTPHPMIDIAPLKIPTFAVTIWGGSLFRMGVSAVPFLLPVMFQIGFGFSPFEAGVLLMAVFAGNLLMKPLTTPVLRQFGFRPVLLWNGLLNAALITACGAFTTATPLWLACLVLFAGGMARSMQFTALNTIAFADVPTRGMANANTIFSTMFQLAMGLGVALGAIGWRVGQALSPSGAPAMPFRIAFVIVGFVALLGLIDCLKLAPAAGAHVAQKTA